MYKGLNIVFGIMFLCLPIVVFGQVIDVTENGVEPNLHKDQTSLINKIIKNNPGSTLVFPPGSYYINSIEVNEDVSIVGAGSGDVIFYGLGPPSKPMVYVVAARLTIKNVILDGNDNKAFGILVYNYKDSVMIGSCIIRNFYGTDSVGAIGIRIRRSEGTVEVINSSIFNINGPENGKVGDRVGANRGITLNDVYNVIIKNCYFSAIKGFEDGDCIHYIRWDKGEANKVLISNNIFTNIYKRAIKIHGNNAEIIGNKVYSFKKHASYSAISVYGDHNKVNNNYIDLSNTVFGIQVTHNNDNIISNNNIIIHKFRSRKNSAPILIKDASDVILENNTNSSPRTNLLLMEGKNKGIKQK